MNNRVVLLAFDTFDWELLQSLVDNGVMPFCEQLLNRGASGRMVVPPPVDSVSLWTSVATGVMADEHGICSEHVVQPDGLTAGPAKATDLACTPVWQRAMESGHAVGVVGWPESYAASVTGPKANSSRIISAGFARYFSDDMDDWPMSPDAVAPPSAREDIDSYRVHASELAPEFITPFLSEALVATYPGLPQQIAITLAEASSVHNVGTAICEANEADLVCVRYPFLASVTSLLSTLNVDIQTSLTPFYRYVDLLIGRYLNLLNPHDHLIVLSDKGLVVESADKVDTYTRRSNKGLAIFSGAGFEHDVVLSDISGLDIFPTIQTLLSIPADERCLRGKALVAAGETHTRTNFETECVQRVIDPSSFLPVSEPDDEAMTWLTSHGVPDVDLTALKKIAANVSNTNRRGWAQAQYAKGESQAAIDVLKANLAANSGDLASLLLLIQFAMEANCPEQALDALDKYPDSEYKAEWQHIIDAFHAFAKQQYGTAIQCLKEQSNNNKALINNDFWIGKLLLLNSNYAEAIPYLIRATERADANASVWRTLGWAYQQEQHWVSALEACHQAVAFAPFNADNFIARAEVYAKQQQEEFAREDLLRAISLGAEPKDYRHLMHSLA